LYSEVGMWFNSNEQLIIFLAALYGCPLPLNHIKEPKRIKATFSFLFSQNADGLAANQPSTVEVAQ